MRYTVVVHAALGVGVGYTMISTFLGKAVQVDSPNCPIFITEPCKYTQSSPLNLANLPNLYH